MTPIEKMLTSSVATPWALGKERQPPSPTDSGSTTPTMTPQLSLPDRYSAAQG